MKALVITLDKTNRLNTYGNECIEAFRPCVVTVTEFVSNLVLLKKIEPFGQLPDTATDAQFMKYWIESKRNPELAVQAFAAAVNGNTTGDLEDETAAEAAADAAATAAKADAPAATTSAAPKAGQPKPEVK